MRNLSHIELSGLFDMLSRYTSLYMKMLSDGATKEEFDQCRETITDIQSEIRSRKNQEGNTSAITENISFNRDHYPVARQQKSD